MKNNQKVSCYNINYFPDDRANNTKCMRCDEIIESNGFWMYMIDNDGNPLSPMVHPVQTELGLHDKCVDKLYGAGGTVAIIFPDE